jgi:hypothetical protein
VSQARRPTRQANWLERSTPRTRPWALEEWLLGGRRELPAEERNVRRTSIEVPSGDPRLDADFTLGHCQGFDVVEGGVAVGVVSDVRYGSRLDRPDEVEITTGRFRRRSFWIPVTEVVEISFEDEAIVLSRRLTASPARLLLRRLNSAREASRAAR